MRLRFVARKIDSATALPIAEAVARLWVGGIAPVRGEGFGVLREGLARFLATLFLEKQFGAEMADAERARERVTYATIAKRDAPLSRTTAARPDLLQFDRQQGRDGLAARRARSRDAMP